MPQKSWSPKRERQYEHIKQSALEGGTKEKAAERIAAATVNKVRAQEGEARDSSATSTSAPSPSRRKGLRSHSADRARTRAQLYEEARQRGIAGRSYMNKSQLEAALKH